MNNDDSLVDELRQHLNLFLEKQFLALNSQPFASSLRLADHKEAFFRSQLKFFVVTKATGILHYAARMFIIQSEYAVSAAGEIKREMLDNYPDLGLTDEEWEAMEIFNRACSTDIEKFTLLAILWRL